MSQKYALEEHFSPANEGQDLAAMSLSETSLGMSASRILTISYAVRERIANGEEIVQYTVGDFSPNHYQVPALLKEESRTHLASNQTNYPPANGMLELRASIRDHYAETLSLDYPLDGIVVGSGARPVLFAAYQCLINPGEKVITPAPGWNNNNFCQIVGAEPVVVASRPEDGFMPTAEGLRPHLEGARLLVICSPMNPSGTMIRPQQLEEICDLILEENRAREERGERLLYLIYDHVYRLLTFDRPHITPVGCRPEMARYTIFSDAISKGFAATGLRVGWMVGPPLIADRVKALMTHMGAWAPKPEQLGTAALLRNPAEINSYLVDFKAKLRQRLDLLYGAISRWSEAGLPVRAIAPEGAMYLSVHFDLEGRAGFPDEDAVRRWLLDQGCAVIPFSCFGDQINKGWFRFSVGAVSVEEVERSLKRLEAGLKSI
ncbi:MAG: pyridoxal phosphate-dependent aminotransferase [Myxococcota bacterium]|nr:pyridoxal phosphate-dependent aminotransferase [Myxococcota bacterium]